MIDEAQHAPPRVGGRVGVFGEGSVEEGVRRAGVGEDLVVDAGVGEPRVEGGDVLGGDEVVGAAEEPKDRAARLADVGQRAGISNGRPIRPGSRVP